MTGAGPETEQAELFPSAGLSEALEPGPNYFDGYALDELTDESRERYGLLSGNTVTRHSYLYEAQYPINTKNNESEYGKIELRGLTWTFRPELPESYWQMVEASAHRAAMIFDSSIQTPGYAGYLTGFQPAKGELPAPTPTRDPGRAYESEDIAVSEEGSVGALIWSVEIYDEDGRLRGIAQGTGHPWVVAEEEIDGSPAVSISPHKWELNYNDSKDGGKYQAAAPGRKDARERYKPGGAGHEKTVCINGKPVGKLENQGRVWIHPKYSKGDGHEFRGKYSREGLVQETEATYQALRDGGTLYLTGEDEETIYLATARAKPDGYRAVDPDEVSPTIEVKPGTPGGTRLVLGLRSTDNALPVECRRDDRIINALGKSTPTYRHTIRRGWTA